MYVRKNNSLSDFMRYTQYSRIFYKTKHNLTTFFSSFLTSYWAKSLTSPCEKKEDEKYKDWSWGLICIYFQSWLTRSNWKIWQFQYFEIEIWKSWRNGQVASILWRSTKAHNLFLSVTRTKSWKQRNTFVSLAVSDPAVVPSKHQALRHIAPTTNPQECYTSSWKMLFDSMCEARDMMCLAHS